jgi:hypothetical protein
MSRTDDKMPCPTVPGTSINQEVSALFAMIIVELRKHPPGFLIAVSPWPPEVPDGSSLTDGDLDYDMAPIDPAHLPMVLPRGWKLYGPLLETDARTRSVGEGYGVQ